MTKKSAAAVVEKISGFYDRIDESVRRFEAVATTGQTRDYRRLVGRIIGNMLMSIVEPILAIYPDLESDSLRMPPESPPDPPLDPEVAELVRQLEEDIREWLPQARAALADWPDKDGQDVIDEGVREIADATDALAGFVNRWR